MQYQSSGITLQRQTNSMQIIDEFLSDSDSSDSEDHGSGSDSEKSESDGSDGMEFTTSHPQPLLQSSMFSIESTDSKSEHAEINRNFSDICLRFFQSYRDRQNANDSEGLDPTMSGRTVKNVKNEESKENGFYQTNFSKSVPNLEQIFGAGMNGLMNGGNQSLHNELNKGLNNQHLNQNIRKQVISQLEAETPPNTPSPKNQITSPTEKLTKTPKVIPMPHGYHHPKSAEKSANHSLQSSAQKPLQQTAQKPTSAHKQKHFVHNSVPMQQNNNKNSSSKNTVGTKIPPQNIHEIKQSTLTKSHFQIQTLNSLKKPSKNHVKTLPPSSSQKFTSPNLPHSNKTTDSVIVINDDEEVERLTKKKRKLKKEMQDKINLNNNSLMQPSKLKRSKQSSLLQK